MSGAASCSRRSPGVTLVIGVLAVSTGAIFVRYADVSPLVAAAWRVGLATTLLLPYALWRAGGELRSLRPAELVQASLAGGFLALHFSLWISSLSYTSVASSVVLVNTNPVWVALLTPLLTRDRMTKRAWFGVMTGVAGTAVIGSGDFNIGGQALLGDLLALGGGLAAAFYLLFGRRLRERLSLLAYLTVCYGIAAVLLWAVVLCAELPAVGFSTKSWGALFGMAVISQIIGHSSCNWALRYFSAGVVAVSLLGEPVLSSLLAWWLFGETLSWIIGGGAILIFIGVYFTVTGGKGHANQAGALNDNKGQTALKNCS